MADINAMTVRIDYTNWRGERAMRVIRPRALRFETNQYHQGEQWLLEAVDLEKNVVRIFAMTNIHSWSAVPIAGTTK